MKKILFFLAAGFFAMSLCQAQIITTVAGTGTAGFSGNGGPATAAQFNFPTSVAFDATGNMYIADASNNMIRKIDKVTGIISTVAGANTTGGFGGDGGPATSALLNGPVCVIFDGAGNMYIVEGANHCVRKVGTNGIITTVAGTGGVSGFTGDGGPATSATMTLPTALTFDASGNMYVVDGNNNRVRQVNTSGIISTVAGGGTVLGDGGPATSAMLYYPYGVKFDASGNMYISDQNNRRVRQVNAAGIIKTIAGSGTTCYYSGDEGPATLAQLCMPHGILIDAAGNLFIVDYSESNIRKVNTAGIITTVAGYSGYNTLNVQGYSGDGGVADEALLTAPEQITQDAAGNIYIADQGNHVIRKVCMQTDSMSGYVKDTANNPVTSGKVYAFRKQTFHNGYHDTVGPVSISPNGYYVFHNVLGDNFMIQAVADTHIYHTAIPTYLSNKLYPYQWDSAALVHNDPCMIPSSTGNNIKIVQMRNYSGPGIVTGQIKRLSSFGTRMGGPGYPVMGAPLKGVDIKLGRNPGGSPVARTTSDLNGNYQFTNVPLGSYKIYVDIPNYRMDTILSVTLTAGSPNSVQNNYYVDSVRVNKDTARATGVITAASIKPVFIYPNPCTGNVTVHAEMPLGDVSLYNLMGEVVFQTRTKSNSLLIDTDKLPAGIYMILTRDGYIRLLKE